MFQSGAGAEGIPEHGELREVQGPLLRPGWGSPSGRESLAGTPEAASSELYSVVAFAMRACFFRGRKRQGVDLGDALLQRLLAGGDLLVPGDRGGPFGTVQPLLGVAAEVSADRGMVTEADRLPLRRLPEDAEIAADGKAVSP